MRIGVNRLNLANRHVRINLSRDDRGMAEELPVWLGSVCYSFNALR
jgi:hypothetical protein